MGEAVDFPEEMSAAARATHARLGLTDPDLLRASLQMDFGEVGRRYLAAVRDLAGASALHDRQAAIQFPLLPV